MKGHLQSFNLFHVQVFLESITVNTICTHTYRTFPYKAKLDTERPEDIKIQQYIRINFDPEILLL